MEKLGICYYEALIKKQPKEIKASDLNIKYGVSLPDSKRVSGPYPLISSNGISDYVNVYNTKNVITFGCRGTLGNVFYHKGKAFILNTAFFINNCANYGNLYFALKHNHGLILYQSGAAQPQITIDAIKNAKIVVPDTLYLNTFVDLIYKYQEILNKLKILKQQLLNKYF
mgnify:CR=1 FL=1